MCNGLPPHQGVTSGARVLAVLKHNYENFDRLASLAAARRFAAPASASQVLEFQDDGRLVPAREPLPAAADGPEVGAARQRAGLPAAEAARHRRPRPVGDSRDRQRPPPPLDHRGRGRALPALYAAARRARPAPERAQPARAVVVVIACSAASPAPGQLTGGPDARALPAARPQPPVLARQAGVPGAPDYGRAPARTPPSNNPAGARIVFQGSPIVFQYYPGQGLQLQPLANFGIANGMITACRHDPATCDRPGHQAAARRAGRDPLLARRLHHLGVLVLLRRRHAAVDERDSRAAPRSRRSRAPPQKSILDDKSYLRVAHSALGVFRTAAAGRRAPAARRRQPLPDLLVRPGAARAERVPPGDHRAVRLREGRARPDRADARTSAATALPSASCTRFDTGRWSLLQRGRSGVVARLPPARDRLPRRPLQAAQGQVLHLLQRASGPTSGTSRRSPTRAARRAPSGRRSRCGTGSTSRRA